MAKDLDKRFWEIDFLRGVAIFLMVAYHFIFDLDYFNLIKLNLEQGIWPILARSIAFIFIYLVGVSLTLSYSRAVLKGRKNLRSKYLKRGIKIFSWGLLITLITRIVVPEAFIIFGVLHLIGLSIILAYPLLKYTKLNLILSILILLASTYINNITLNTSLFLWIGLKPLNFYTLDYFPLLPWFGVVTLGIFTGNLMYSEYKRKIQIPDMPKNPLIYSTCYAGKKSLLIYLLHQPIIILILYIAGFNLNLI
ncbi:MAG: putative membrane protein [Candidatus Methanohalarchaeum thermophilum]|uniref:Membrane protein n=1 Tax=Methanohalarchaeum thermophilum TaxID=1903181 RepID=A0A1Q6DTZ8_METT1|nr:MAG: putative membrane protein [Candidatus Methanohalarchaeum thermophilum]